MAAGEALRVAALRGCGFVTSFDQIRAEKQRFAVQSASKAGLFAPFQPSWKYAPVLATGALEAVLVSYTRNCGRSSRFDKSIRGSACKEVPKDRENHD
jgi:hypothetical protein